MTPAAPERPYITCRELIDFIADYLDGELAPDQNFEFERHLSACPSCVNYLDTYKKTFVLSRRVMSEPEALDEMPEELVHSILLSRRPTQSAK